MPDWKPLRPALLPLAALISTALAAPVLPGKNVAESALASALAPQAATPAPAAQAPVKAPTVAQAPTVQATAAQTPAKSAPVVAQTTVKPAAAPVAPIKASAPQPSAPKKAVVVKAAPAKPKVARVAPKAKPTAPSAAQLRQQAIAQAERNARARGARSAVVRATAYNSFAGQTDASPTITATGTRVRFGVIALSRDLLRRFPYGSKVSLQDMSGRFSKLLSGKTFVVEDTMHPRISNTIDVWMPTRGQAVQWGARNVRITAVQ